ncbi:receptor-type tyrosine-protein phosphatase eta [Paroedura picta]|uniref:receptor-type tyrosine-protein phosphatase eta n=1 Tax=Paroedura picta TaxID=143630 RepID=UPI0040561110
MRQLVLLSPLLVLWLSQIKVLAACNDCSSVNVTAGNTEIHIQKPHNFTIINVTFANGTVVNGPLNDSISGLEPGVQYIVYLQNITEICCKIITTVPTRVFGVLFTNINATTINVTWNNADQNAHNYSYIIIIIDGNGHNRTENTTNITTVISNLEPGTLYTFTIYPEVGGTSGDAYTDSTFTMPNAVSGFHIENINSTAVNLRWNNTDTNSANYTYEIVFGKYGTEMSVLTNDTRTTIGNLEPGTMYTFTIFPKANETKGDSTTASIYTKPNAVSGFHIENINSTTVNLRWNNTDTNSANYTYEIVFGKYGTGMSVLTNDTKTTIGNLEPGTMYTFTIFPKANETKGDSTTASIYTKPNAVSGFHIENINSTAVNLRWNNTDTNSANYTYEIVFGKYGTGMSVLTNDTRTTIGDLEPGTMYTFTIFPKADATKGDSTTASIYTKPNAVSGFHIENINSTAVNLRWNNTDTNSANYTYEIVFGKYGTGMSVLTNDTRTTIGDLEPGTMYTFTIFPKADATKGDSTTASIYTKPNAVSGFHIGNINSTAVNLRWNNTDTNSANYTYEIVFEKDGTGMSVLTNDTRTTIGDLEPGTMYTFTIFPKADATKGDSTTASIYTMPTCVFGVLFTNINATTINVTWNNADQNAHNYSYIIIIIDGNGHNRTENTTNITAVISNLEPGTLYTFTIYPEIGGTSGDAYTDSTFTIPSSVSNITAMDISSVEVNLSWVNMDIASHTYSYRMHIRRENGPYENKTTQSTNATISKLTPGVNYTFNIYSVAADNTTEGKPKSISLFTKPSAVSNIIVKNISTDGITLSWSIEDEAASGYTYRIYIENENLPGENFTYHSPTKTVFIQKLKPGTSYHFSIFAQVDSGRTEGDSTSVSNCTDAATVKALNCAPVLKQPELNLSWIPPNGNYNNFSIEISGGTLNKTAYYSSKDQVAIIKDLSYFVSYNVKIVTHSCGEMSFPQEKKCLTSITDPPVPLESPAVKATGHNSLKVQFSPFDSTHGPLKAYAVIITSKEMKCNNESLTGTYEDFTNKKSDSYIACVKDVQHSSNVTHYDIEIGDGSTSHGYRNGKLVPLGSYRACVAGFTHITFKADAISSRESYVSFSDFSGSVVLPQNPDVITGAVSGCILAAVLVAAIAFFIFWKKRRKDGKNNDVPFSPIAAKKSKLIKVENFESYFKKQKADSNCGFAEEYEDLRPVGVNQPKFAAELPENKGKNRYNNVLPYDISRVKLSGQYHPTSDYINANYVPGYNSRKEFIAAQGCLPNTVQDFWRMIWEKNIHTIVMLTKCIEQGRTKCEEYWPNKQSKNYGDITVAMTSEIILPEWTVRDFSMEKSDASVSQPVRQFHFTAWPDHGVPETTDLLISFRHLVQNYMKQNPPTPTLVHCSAGVGRTGTFIAIDRLIHQMEMENTVDVYGVVYDLRMHRPLMVQTEDQYVFLNQCVMDIIKSRKERKADLIYQNANAMAIYENFRPSPHLGKANGYHM